MITVTKELLLKIAPLGKDQIVTDVATYLNQYMASYEINTPLRLANLLAQCAHESDGFKTLEEYASGAAYEGRKDLGNTEKGDGVKYKGRGMIQLTGRGNYTIYGARLNLDLVNNPTLAATGKVSVLTALEYWKTKGLNALADKDDINTITHRINGGENGLPQRIAYLAKAKAVIGGAPATTTTTGPFNPILAQKGDKSDYVKSIQNLLIAKNYTIVADGVFGPATETAVKNFQTRVGLSITGQVDQTTLDKLKA